MTDPMRHVAETAAGAVVASSWFWLDNLHAVVAALASLAGLIYMLLKIWQVIRELQAPRGRIDPMRSVLLPWAVAMLLASAAIAAPPEGAPTSGPVHEWFQKPEVRACCSAADCRPHRVRLLPGGWEVETDAGWLPVPEVAIKQEPSPTFQTIVCIPPMTGVPLCLFWGGGV